MSTTNTATTPTDHRAATINRLTKKGGLRASIDAKCCECIYDPTAVGTWRNQVLKCTSTGCPLYAVRPKSSYETCDVLDTERVA
ncbi:MAG: hypothetical protein KZQ96_23355 [Candidatus Thiodiazotropha sp. (ex Lucinoma borealis)]|nr:hypothetical protein [Candidatus Thiodiazotropha sp. (ex Lucinoma borealis)]